MEHNLLASKQRYRNLDVYKGICILFIIITHYSWTEEQRIKLLFPLWIDMAVPVFMVITGYVYSISSYSKQRRFWDNYQLRTILSKWLRYTIPFVPAWCIGVVARIIGKGQQFSIKDLIIDFFEGGIGPGSYYFPIMLQVVLLIPIIIRIVNVYKEKGIIGMFAFNVAFETFQHIIHLPTSAYRLCVLRYVFILSFGCYLYVNRTVNKTDTTVRCYVAVGVAGLIFIVYYRLLGHTPIFTNSDWAGTSVFAVLFIVPVMALLIEKTNIKNRVLEQLGMASYEIFLVQMVYFLVGNDIMQRFIPVRPLQIIGNVLICCCMGVIYYKIENPLLLKIVRRIDARLQ